MASLGTTVEPNRVIEALRRDYRMPQRLIASSTGASVRTVRNWERTGAVKPRYQQRVADLRDVVLILDDSLTAKGIGQWLEARHRVLDGRTAASALADGDYEAVRDAALAYATGTYV